MPGSGSMAVGPTMYKSLPYEPTKDFAPMALIGRVPFVLIVNTRLPVKTVPELIAHAKTEQDVLRHRAAPGSPHHIYAEMFKGMTGIEMTHVPYKGSADAIKDVVAGHMQMHVLGYGAVDAADPQPARCTALGVTTMARWPAAPDIPPLNEAGVPGFDAAGWFMVSGPAGTPQPIVERLHAELKAIMGLPDVQQAVEPHRRRAGGQPVAGRAAEIHQHREGALGQGSAAGRARRNAVETRNPLATSSCGRSGGRDFVSSPAGGR